MRVRLDEANALGRGMVTPPNGVHLHAWLAELLLTVPNVTPEDPLLACGQYVSAQEALVEAYERGRSEVAAE